MASSSSADKPEDGACAGEGHSAVSEFLGNVELPATEAAMFAVVPLGWCPHLEGSVNPVPEGGLVTSTPCQQSGCEDTRENWVCLCCYGVYCGRFINEHMLMHHLESNHPLTLSYADLSVWCYPCDSYVHNIALLPAKRAAHLSKFGQDIPE
ncbi:histone deacetylase 6-like [Saccoglossus kowalevskii]|uniref:Histone deacetylase 6-like n=1 Tax=Saccoglossus kowalevskii TaxID=10224 RepID=A0ABM0GK51_SACKO|nr:PREDICTED: histone deacetylase 6-like [Saccoglossus kowalevskii]